MNLVVVDFEATTRGEIVEIGAAYICNENKGTLSKIVKPTNPCNKEDLRFSGLTLDKVNQGVPYQIAHKEFLLAINNDCIFASWGQSDLDMYSKNCVLHGVTQVISTKNYFNVQKVYGALFPGKPKSLDKAYYIVTGEYYEHTHTGVRDAEVAFEILLKLKEHERFKAFLKGSHLSEEYKNKLI